MSRGSAGPDERRARLRDRLWPGSAGWVWDPSDKAVKGYARVTRLLPLVMRLIREKAEKPGDPSMVYLDLWVRDRGQGLVTIDDPDACAFSAGYSGKRARRTWEGHMRSLVALGFILTKKVGGRDHAQVLLLDPLAVCARYEAEGNMPGALWNAMLLLADEVGAEIPGADKIAEAHGHRLATTGADAE